MIKKNDSLTLFEHLRRHGTADSYAPESHPNPTNAAPGSSQKIEVLIKRLELGQDLWNERDRDDYEGLLAPINPRKK